MSVKFDTTDFTVAIKHLNTSSKKLQKELVDNLHAEASPLESSIKGAAFTRIQRRAASTVNVARDSEGLTVHGGGGGLGGTLFAGGEFGGRKSKKKSYSTRSPNGMAYVVRRRTTMMFLPHLGQEGYFLWPQVREFLPRLLKIQTETVERVMGGGK